VYPKNPPGFFGYVPGCLNPASKAWKEGQKGEGRKGRRERRGRGKREEGEGE